MSRLVLFEDERGYLAMEGNELTVGSKIDDPPKVRLTAPIYPKGGGGGCISYNASYFTGQVCFGSQQLEMGLDRVEQAEDVRGDQGNLKAERNFLLNDGSSSKDSAMKKPLAFVWNAITRLFLNLGGGDSRPDTMWAPDGLSFTQQQNDKNFVTYEVDQPFDKGANPRALWSAWTGKIS